MIKVVFLDMDGVLVPFQVPKGRENLIWSVEAMECLNAVCERSAAQIVVSSSWRIDSTKEEMQRMLTEHGFRGLFHRHWRTPGSENLLSERGTEIRRWLDAHNDVTRWLVIDDSAEVIVHFDSEIRNRTIEPVPQVGLTMLALESALKILTDDSIRSQSD